jgi:DNA-binding MarR family transcriptional regulator
MPMHQTAKPTTPAHSPELLDMLFTIYLVGRKMKQVAKKHHPVHVQDFMLEMGMLRLIDSQPSSVSDLAEALSTGLSATSERIKMLVKSGFVLQTSGSDARQNWCQITPTGKKHLQTTMQQMSHSCHVFTNTFSINEIATVKNVMTKILTKLV